MIFFFNLMGKQRSFLVLICMSPLTTHTLTPTLGWTRAGGSQRGGIWRPPEMFLAVALGERCCWHQASGARDADQHPVPCPTAPAAKTLPRANAEKPWTRKRAPQNMPLWQHVTVRDGVPKHVTCFLQKMLMTRQSSAKPHLLTPALGCCPQGCSPRASLAVMTPRRR